MRKRPMISSSTPLPRATSAAMAACAAPPGAAKDSSDCPNIRDVMAAGPTDMARLLPKAAYPSSGKRLASSPACGGSPASMA
ncbi:MAG: hypothetical protein QM742_06965 [Aquabacterium sp.]